MSNYGRNVDTVHLGQSYANQRRISGPRKMPSKGFKDKYKKIIAGILAAGTLLVGANQLSNNRQERNQRLDIVDKFSGALEQTYEGSEYLQLNFRQGDYVEYCEETLNDTLKSEDELVEFLSKEEFDKNTWLYILIGEGNRIDLSDEEIISALQQFEPYSEENITFDKNTGNPDRHVSYFTQLGKACLTEENKVNLILLLDGIVGSSSISNSNEAINYAKEQVKSAYSEIGEGWKDSLRQNININNNFEENVAKDSTYLKPYIENVYNQRIKTAQEIANGETLKDVKNPEILAKLIRSLAKKDVIKDSYRVLKYGSFDIDPKVASADEYKKVRDTRNDFYQYCIDGIDNPEKAKEELNNINEKLDEKSKIYILVQSRSEKLLEEILSITSNQHEKTNSRDEGFSR